MLGWGITNSNFSFVKILQEGEEWIYKSILLQSMMVDGKMIFLKKK